MLSQMNLKQRAVVAQLNELITAASKSTARDQLLDDIAALQAAKTKVLRARSLGEVQEVESGITENKPG